MLVNIECKADVTYEEESSSGKPLFVSPRTCVGWVLFVMGFLVWLEGLGMIGPHLVQDYNDEIVQNDLE
jgi:hypothetical protein